MLQSQGEVGSRPALSEGVDTGGESVEKVPQARHFCKVPHFCKAVNDLFAGGVSVLIVYSAIEVVATAFYVLLNVESIVFHDG